MVKKDFVERVIEDIAKALAKTLLGKETVIYELPSEEETMSDTDHLYQELINLLEQGDICKAEDLLYDNIRAEDNDWYEMALSFYLQVNKKDEMFLEEHNYSREEIKQGMEDITKRCGFGEFPALFD